MRTVRAMGSVGYHAAGTFGSMAVGGVIGGIVGIGTGTDPYLLAMLGTLAAINGNIIGFVEAVEDGR